MKSQFCIISRAPKICTLTKYADKFNVVLVHPVSGDFFNLLYLIETEKHI
jgi:hypothetical protein